MELGSKIREIRKRKGFSQEELAQLAKVNLRTIQRIESNENEPRGKTIQLICEVLEVNIEEIIDYQKYNDCGFIRLFYLSVLTFLVLPLGNIIVPFILWVTKKDKIVDLEHIGKNVLNFQIVWSILSYSFIILYTLFKIMHLTYNGFEWSDLMLYIYLSLVGWNLFLTIYSCIQVKNDSSKVFYPRFLRIIK